jgi:hypothetical protein
MVVVGWINFIVLMSNLIIFKLYEVMSLYIDIKSHEDETRTNWNFIQINVECSSEREAVRVTRIIKKKKIIIIIFFTNRKFGPLKNKIK